jgi:polysaccharide biosynthesis/export protein
MMSIIDAQSKLEVGGSGRAEMFELCQKSSFYKPGQLKLASRRRFRLLSFQTASGQPTGMSKSIVLSLILLQLLLPSEAVSQQSSGKVQTVNKVLVARSGNESKGVQRQPIDATDYLIGPEDLIRVSVWKEPEITQVIPVRPDGKISLALVNDLQAAGLTPAQLAASVAARLRNYMTDPQVTVVVTQINSQRIYVLGEINRPGAYPLFPGMSVLQALSTAGGLGQFANLKRIYVLRTEKGQQVKYYFNYKDVVSEHKPEQNILLKTGDTIIVP